MQLSQAMPHKKIVIKIICAFTYLIYFENLSNVVFRMLYLQHNVTFIKTEIICGVHSHLCREFEDTDCSV